MADKSKKKKKEKKSPEEIKEEEEAKAKRKSLIQRLVSLESEIESKKKTKEHFHHKLNEIQQLREHSKKQLEVRLR